MIKLRQWITERGCLAVIELWEVGRFFFFFLVQNGHPVNHQQNNKTGKFCNERIWIDCQPLCHGRIAVRWIVSNPLSVERWVFFSSWIHTFSIENHLHDYGVTKRYTLLDILHSILAPTFHSFSYIFQSLSFSTFSVSALRCKRERVRLLLLRCLFKFRCEIVCVQHEMESRLKGIDNNNNETIGFKVYQHSWPSWLEADYQYNWESWIQQ